MNVRFSILVVMFACSFAAGQATQPSYSFDIRGVVTDRAGKPIADAQVDAFTGGRNHEPPRPFTLLGGTRSDANGRFELTGLQKPFEGAPHLVRAIAPGMGYGYTSGPIIVASGELRDFPQRDAAGRDEAWITLAPAEVIRGRVVDETGAPVIGAQLISELPIDPIRTDENGMFSFTRATPANARNDEHHSNRILRIVHPDYVIDRIGQARYSSNVQAIARRGLLVTGRLTELESGAPMKTGYVVAQFKLKNDVAYYSQYMAFCDAEGRYQLRLPSDLGLVDLHPHADAYRTADPSFEPTETFHRIVSEEPGPMQVDFTFRRLPESPVRRADKSRRAPPTTRRIVYAAWEKLNLAGIKGKVLDEHGKPVVRARLYVIDLTTPYESDPRSPSEKKPVARPLTSNFAGAFEYPYIDSDQPLWIIAWDQAGERVAQIATTPGTREVEVRLSQRGAKITGTIRDEAGKPVEGIPVHLSAAREHQVNFSIPLLRGVTDANGRYEIVGYIAPPEGVRNRLQVGSPLFNWDAQPEQRISFRARRYIHFPVKPGETLDGLDFTLTDRGERLPVPTREEYTREP